VESFKAWDEVMKGRENPLAKMLSENKEISSKLSPSEVRKLLNPKRHTGDAKERCELFVKESLDPVLKKHRKRAGATGKVEY
jgi:hypothetical protein